MVRLPVAATPRVHADHDRDGEARKQPEQRGRRVPEKNRVGELLGQPRKTAAGGGSSDGGAMPALVRPCHRARTSAIGNTPSRIRGRRARS